MASFTTNYGLEKLASGESFQLNDQKYTEADRDLIDALLKLGAETHHHNGVSTASLNPSTPGVSLAASGGSLPAGNTAYYKYTLVDSHGLETAPSPAASQALPSLAATPAAPTVSYSNAAGTLPAGTYLYQLSAYTGSSFAETLPSAAVSITTAATGEIIVTFPTLPSGASGFNIYRFSPGGTTYLYMATVAVSGGTPATWTDNGSVAANCNRFPPTSNTTNSTSEITVNALTPPSGYTWKLYRTFDNTNWGNTLLATGSSDTYLDTGSATSIGTPPTVSELVGNPSKVALTAGAEVQGLLPASMVDFASIPQVPFAVTFTFSGYLTPTTGVSTWVCPFSSATVVWTKCTLGRGSIPASQAVIADVLKGTGVNPTYSTIYISTTKPQIPVGHQVGPAAVPNSTTLAVGDTLSVDIDQAGGGTTPTDHDLTVTVKLLVSS